MIPLRVLSYNLRVPGSNEREPPWSARRDMIASIIRFQDATLVGVQEARPQMLSDLSDRLYGYTWVGTGRTADPSEHCAIFAQTNRVNLLRHNTFWLSDTPTVEGSQSWGASHPRVVTWAKVDISGWTTPLYLFNTHFDHESPSAREESARLLRQTVEEIADAPVVITGDLNATPDSVPYQLLIEPSDTPPFRDALHESERPHHGPTSTFNGFGGPGNVSGRIDYIFVRGPLTVYRHGTLTDHWDGIFPSDHWPVLADVAPATS